MLMLDWAEFIDIFGLPATPTLTVEPSLRQLSIQQALFLDYPLYSRVRLLRQFEESHIAPPTPPVKPAQSLQHVFFPLHTRPA